MKPHRRNAKFAEMCRRESELSSALERVVEERSSTPPLTAAEATAEIVDAVDQLRERKIKAASIRRRQSQQTRQQPGRIAGVTLEWAAKLVRLTASSRGLGGQLRRNEEKSIDDAIKVTTEHLSPVERRAAELVCGARPKPKKNIIEARTVLASILTPG
jgi:hypothetical protein